MGNEGNQLFKPTPFIIKRVENALKCATLTFKESTKNHNDPQVKNKESTRGFMYALTPVNNVAKNMQASSNTAEIHKPLPP